MQVTKFYYLLWGYICPMKARIVYELKWGGGVVHMEFGKHLLRIFHRENFVLKKEKPELSTFSGFSVCFRLGF